MHIATLIIKMVKIKGKKISDKNKLFNTGIEVTETEISISDFQKLFGSTVKDSTADITNTATKTENIYQDNPWKNAIYA